MRKLLAILVLVAGMVTLSFFLFGHGLLFDFYEITSSLTSVTILENTSEATVPKIIKFAINIFIYFAAAALLVFLYEIIYGKK